VGGWYRATPAPKTVHTGNKFTKSDRRPLPAGSSSAGSSPVTAVDSAYSSKGRASAIVLF